MTAVELHDVVLRRGGRTILDGVSAELPAGAATAVVGPSGAGKSTLLAVVAGFEPVDSGTVVNPFPPDRTGVVLQAYGLIRLLTAAENVELPLQSAGLPPAEVRERAAAELARLGLERLAERRVDELSGGQQQRLAIARALVVRPRLLLADELTSELDPRNRDRILQEILGLTERGTTVVIATHDGSVAARCDHVVRVGGPSSAEEAAAARAASVDAAVEQQEARVRAQQAVVERERARLDDLEQALRRLRDQQR